MHAIDPDVPLILFTLSDAWSLESAARKAGICQVVSKSEPLKLMDSIEQIASESITSGPSAKASAQPRTKSKSAAR
jgi:hypothetical protein